MSLTETEKKTAVLWVSDLLRPGSLSCEFECKGILETRIWLFYLLFDYDSYHLSIAFFNRGFNEGKIWTMKFRDDERNCSIYL